MGPDFKIKNASTGVVRKFKDVDNYVSNEELMSKLSSHFGEFDPRRCQLKLKGRKYIDTFRDYNLNDYIKERGVDCKKGIIIGEFILLAKGG